jgi:ribosomal subunit interface protein
MAKIEKLDPKVIRVDVEVSEERNPRQSDRRERIELTIRSRGPVIRAEAAADDRYGALDVALGKLESRLRRLSERRKQNHSAHGRERLAMALAAAGETGDPAPGDAPIPLPADFEPTEPSTPAHNGARIVPISMEGEAPVVVREKFHEASPMTIDQALTEMELVGHDFFLFRDRELGKPSVVYRRHGWDYGVIRLVDD